MDEIEELDTLLADSQMVVERLTNHIADMRTEWEEMYPLEALEFAMTTIERLASKVFDFDPEDVETQDLLSQADDIIMPKRSEPEVFYLK